MIINKIRVQELNPMQRWYTGANWPLPVCDLNLDSSAGDNGYLVRDVVGLDPPDLNVIVDGFDTAGNPIFGNYSEGREVSILIELTPTRTQTPSELRDGLYKFISRGLKLSFMYDSVVQAEWPCAIKTIEAVHFASKPTIKVILTSKYSTFAAPKKIDVPVSLFANPSVTLDYSEGSAPAAFKMVFTKSSGTTVTSLRFFDHANEWHDGTTHLDTNFEITYGFATADVVTIISEPETHTATLLRSGVTYDLEGYLNAFAVWPRLIPGVNAFEWSGFLGHTSYWTVNEISYIPRFWGV